MLRFKFLPKFSIVIFCSFILFTIIGTLSHELGHIAVAKYFDYDITFDYGSMNYFHEGYLKDPALEEINNIVAEYDYNNYMSWPEDIKLKVEALSLVLDKKYPSIPDTHALYVTLGGPLQTLLTSFIGLFILFFRLKKRKDQFKLVDWLAVFMALFALREVFNYVQAIYGFLYFSESDFNSDEFKISRYLGYNEWVVPSVAMLFGLVMACYIIFKIVPIQYRFTFILSGLVGGVVGFALWFCGLGALLFNSTICF